MSRPHNLTGVAFARTTLVLSLLAGPRLLGQPDPRGLKHGFRDLKFGDPVPQGMRRISDDKPLGFSRYNRPSDSLKIGTVPLRKIDYGFLDGHLISVTIFFPRSQFDTLVSELTVAWDAPADRAPSFASWKASITDAWIACILDHDCTLAIQDPPALKALKDRQAVLEKRRVKGDL